MIRDDVTGGWMVKRVWREDVVLASEEKKKNEWMCKNLDCVNQRMVNCLFFFCVSGRCSFGILAKKEIKQTDIH